MGVSRPAEFHHRPLAGRVEGWPSNRTGGISRIRLVWGFSCQAVLVDFSSSHSLVRPRRRHSSAPAMNFSGHRAQAPSRSVGAPTSTYAVRWPGRTLTVASTAASCRGWAAGVNVDPRGARLWRALHEPSLYSVLSIWIATMKQSSASVAELRGGGAILSTAVSHSRIRLAATSDRR